MPKFNVSVEKKHYTTGTIEVEAPTAWAAKEAVRQMLNDPVNPLQTTDERITWGDPVYQDDSLNTTGDVDSADDEVSEPDDDDESNRMNPDHHDDAVS